MKKLEDLGLDSRVIAAIEALRNQLQARFAVERFILFGSVARGAADEESDIDLLIVLKERADLETCDEISSTIFEINLEYETNLSGLVVDRPSWDQGFITLLPIHEEIEDQGISLL